MLKRIVILAIVMIMLAASPLLADPWLVSDPNPGTTVYRITGLPWITNPVDARSDGSLVVDLASAEMDVAYSIQVEAGNAWGYSSSVPFDFTPTLPNISGNIRIMTIPPAVVE